ncbi:MAG: hypothetical protein AAF806_09595 [Bacteroidota bacterium]
MFSLIVKKEITQALRDVRLQVAVVLTLLLPLLITSPFYNLYATEKEGGMLPLLRAQAISTKSVFIVNGGLRFLLVLGIASLLLSLGFLLHDISISKNAASFFQFLFLTCAFWTALVIGVTPALHERFTHIAQTDRANH